MRSFVRAKLGDIDFALMSACEIWKQLNSIMQEAITVYVPQRVVSRHHKPLWMTTKVIRSVKKKHKLRNKWKKSNDNSIELHYKKTG